MTDFGDAIESFAEMAALMANLDLIVTCDSAPRIWQERWACRCGSRCRILPIGAGCSTAVDSPWYPTMRLFRQSRRGDWQPVFQQMANELLRRPAN